MNDVDGVTQTMMKTPIKTLIQNATSLQKVSWPLVSYLQFSSDQRHDQVPRPCYSLPQVMVTMVESFLQRFRSAMIDKDTATRTRGKREQRMLGTVHAAAISCDRST